nr:MAG TPA: hypothetical protein [Caudoviricetes sp.]
MGKRGLLFSTYVNLVIVTLSALINIFESVTSSAYIS